jgi:cell division septation protein DedD
MSDGTFTRSRLFEPRMPESRAADRPMADRRGPTPDPLSELARLIGRSDPYAPAQGRDQSGRDQLRGDERSGSDPPRAPPVWGRDYPRVEVGPGDQGRYADQQVDDDRHVARTPPPRFPIPPDHSDQAGMSASSGFFRHPGQFEHPAAPALEDDASVDPHAYADPQAAHYDQALGSQEEYAGEFAETNEYGEEYDYETDLEEEPGEDDGAVLKRRHTTKVVLAVLALAVFGPAAAFGFRAIFKGGVQGPPPIIRADNSPTKAMPTGAPGAGEAGIKPINERLGDGRAERMVRREEEPVELNRAAGGVMPGTGGPFDSVGGLPPATSAPATTGPASAMEPKRVRTVHIPAGEGVAPPERTVPPPARAAAPPRPAASQSAPSSNSAGAGAGAPLAITPQANAEPPPARAATTSAAASRATDSGGFVVQLSAAKSEADAQASFRAMQSKYAVLNGQHSLIRRKDQGERGVFFAAQVGPYGTKEEATQVCEGLKSAGGTCFVQKN